jgi:hypothetical protein
MTNEAAAPKVPLFYQKISEVVAHAQAQGIAPKVDVERRTTTVADDLRPLIERARDIASYGPMGKWFVASALAATAGFQVHVHQNKDVKPEKPAVESSPAKAPAKSEIELTNGIRLVPVRFHGEVIRSVHPEDRIGLAKAAAKEEHLDKVLGKDSWKTVYGMITAESNWMPRDGMGNNNRPSYGIAQMELPTAKALGVNPHDPKESAKGVATLVKEAAYAYAAKKKSGFEITDESGRALPHKAALATYISVHYNTSTGFRKEWDGNVSHLLQPTQAHIKNVEYGAGEAGSIEKQVKQQKTYEEILRRRGTPVVHLADEEAVKTAPASGR